MTTQTATSASAMQAAAGGQLYPAPDWVDEAANDNRYAWVRLAWTRSASVPGAWFDEQKADAVVRLWPKAFRLTEDRFAGKPFRLVLWQECIVRLLVGWKSPVEVLDEGTGEDRTVHVRLYRRLMLWIPRKNGKSEFLAALAILFFVLDGVEGGQGFVFARDEKQAAIVFDKMKAMIGMSPEMSGDVKSFKKTIYVPQIRALFRLLAGRGEGKHGLSPTVIVGDEMHEWETLDVSTTLRQGTGARLEPIELYASTAGIKSKLVGHGLWEDSLAIHEGRIVEPTTLVVIFAADPEDDWQDEDVWLRANPSLGLSPTKQFLRREAALAVDNPRAEAHFRRYHLNQWVEQLVRWLNMKKWASCAPDPTAWARYGEELAGRKCWGALDVSSTQDITALIWIFPPAEPGERVKLVCRFWVPEDTMEVRVKRDRVQYDQWVSMGAMEVTPGDYVDQNFVLQAIQDGLSLYDVQGVGYDPWNARKLVTDLHKDGVDESLLIEMRQGIPTLGEPSKEFERIVISGLMDHGGHPVLGWMARNTDVRFDENMNFAPAKKRSREKIDGIVAAVMATGLMMAGDGGPSLDDFISNPVMVL